MATKCFWCGSINEKANTFCKTCGRKLQWSNFFKAMLRPSVGYLLGEDETNLDKQLVTAGPTAAMQ